ncbi:hypothetical protein GLE_5419 [Lysobacter enzymogenes]|uniref:Uncharacterized protein n=1 Tax=Lysobacter enzymogenes TaxID=69 RepID=A0A0S2DRE6_LYSEN|nr:hypothetical protein GLE_5419 [Lysobacter enzymogenes]
MPPRRRRRRGASGPAARAARAKFRCAAARTVENPVFKGFFTYGDGAPARPDQGQTPQAPGFFPCARPQQDTRG